jgi:hypothetical protein
MAILSANTMVILTCCTHYGQAFARGFLDLEGFLTPILASLVSKDKVHHMRPAATTICSSSRRV